MIPESKAAAAKQALDKATNYHNDYHG